MKNVTNNPDMFNVAPALEIERLMGDGGEMNENLSLSCMLQISR